MRHDYTFIRGDTQVLDLDLTNPNTQEAYVWTDATIRMTVEDLFEKTRDDGIEVDESSGDLIVTIEPDDTDDSSDYRATYRYDLQVTTSDGAVTTPQRGLITVLPDVDPL